jgi:hypothetical protein
VFFPLPYHFLRLPFLSNSCTVLTVGQQLYLRLLLFYYKVRMYLDKRCQGQGSLIAESLVLSCEVLQMGTLPLMNARLIQIHQIQELSFNVLFSRTRGTVTSALSVKDKGHNHPRKGSYWCAMRRVTNGNMIIDECI